MYNQAITMMEADFTFKDSDSGTTTVNNQG